MPFCECPACKPEKWPKPSDDRPIQMTAGQLKAIQRREEALEAVVSVARRIAAWKRNGVDLTNLRAALANLEEIRSAD